MKKKAFMTFSAMILLVAGLVFAHDGGQRANRARSSALYKGSPRNTRLNINNLSHWFGADLLSANDPRTGNSGLEFPRGISASLATIFIDGLVWGGNVNDGKTPAWRVGGLQYAIGTVEGAITSPGVAESPSQADVRIYRIRRDYATADLKLDAAELGLGEDAVRAQYKTDWLEWPAAKGAPFYDADGDGQYNPGFTTNADGVEIPKLAPGKGETFDPAVNADEPGVAQGDQVVWTVANDLSEGTTAGFAGALPFGVEVQLAAWGYNRTGALGNMIFKQYKLIWKGTATTPAGATADPMYIAQWSDPDLGTYSDDFVGVDSTLSLMFVYNSSDVDATYAGFGFPPPSTGYDFFQGALIPGDPTDEAIFGLKKRPGFKNRGIDVFAYFAAGTSISDPGPLGTYETSLEWRNLFNGCLPQSDFTNCDPYTNTVTGQPTKFPLGGDPVAQTGDLDGITLSPGDRRMLSVTGPFTLTVGDTQEVVVSTIAALGSDRLGSVAVLKGQDKTAQEAFDNLFELVGPPAGPIARATGLDGEIIINWGFTPERVALTESQNERSFVFEGYNVYQLKSNSPDLSPDNAKRLATFDLVNGIQTILSPTFDQASGEVLNLPVQLGTDSGIQHSFRVTADAFRSRPLANHQDYYFAVTAYNYTADVNQSDRSLESRPQVLAVRAQQPAPGQRISSSFGDALEVTHNGTSDGGVKVTIVDPTAITGHDYEVVFENTSAGAVWHLLDSTTGDTVLANQTKQVTDASDVAFNNADGLRVQVLGAPLDAKRMPNGGPAFIQVAGPNGPLTPDDYDGNGAPFGGNNVWHSLNAGIDGGRWLLSAGGGSGGESRLLRNNNIGNAVPFDLEWRFEGADAGLMWWIFDDGSVAGVPFTIWNVGIGTFDDPSDDKQLIPLSFSGGGTPGVYDYSGGENWFGITKCFDWVYAYDGDYAVFAADAADGSIDGDEPSGNEFFSRAVVCDAVEFGFPSINGQAPLPGTTVRIFTTKPNQPGADSFTFSTSDISNTESTTLKKADAMARVNVFPNPYMGVNRLETSSTNRFMRFTNLPDNSKIRIFNLAGHLVRTLSGAQGDQQGQDMDWDLQNEKQLPVASGIYVAYVEMPGVGTKNLKLVVVQEEQFLKTF